MGRLPQIYLNSPGSLHKAIGGFLMLEAEQLLEQPYAWQG
jgi:predicted ATP-dependent protease